jgi:F-type H+-transporting ATPase subunit delta
MAKHFTIARPYAQAVFEQAQSGSQFEAWATALQVLALSVADDRVSRMLHDPKISDDALNKFFYQVLQSCVQAAAEALGEKLKNFLSILVYAKRLEILADIETLYHRLVAAHQNIVEAEVVSAFAMSDAQQKEFYAKLEKRFNSEVSIAFKEDKNLIGGVVLRSGNWVLDGSIRGKISKLSESLLG